VARWLALVAIALGTLVVGYNEEQRNTLLSVAGHGVHTTDIVGAALIAAGSALLWHSNH
jgi:hypothetical protein